MKVVRLARVVFLALGPLLIWNCLNAQVATGTPPYQTFSQLGPDVINVGNLNMHLTVPVLNKTGRGQNFVYNLSYDSSVWTPVTSGGVKFWQPVTGWGWHGFFNSPSYITYTMTTTSGTCGIGGGHSYQTWSFSNVIYWDPNGTARPYPNGGTYISSDNSTSCPPTGPNPSTNLSMNSTDGSGMTMNTLPGAGTLSAFLTTSTGSTLRPPVYLSSTSAPTSSTYSSTDSNGNQVTATNGVFTDTTNHTALTISGSAPSNTVFSYANTAGAQSQVKVSYATYNIHTYFQCSGVTEYTATNVSLVDKITLPDTSFYQFHYETTSAPGFTGYYSGRLASVTLPTGGTISYAYSGGSNGIACADGSAAGLTRTISSDAGSSASTWTYTRSIGTGTSSTTIVDGNGNSLKYDFVLANATSGTTANYYETSRSVYQGALSGTPVISRQTCYAMITGSCNTTSIGFPIYKIDVTETLDGTATHGWTSIYDGVSGVQTESDIYDYASGSTRGGLLRKEVWTLYGGQLPGLITDDKIYDGTGTTLAGHTTYTPGDTVTGTSGVPQHIGASGSRGNILAVTVYANSSTSYTTNNTFWDTGSLKTSTSPNGTTQWSYDSTYTYPTGVTYPTPSSGVALTTGASFDTSYSGLPLSSTDPNGQITSISAYDNMFRPTLTVNPDGGYTSYTYSPVQTSSFSMQNSSTNVDTESLLDSYGRQSRLSVSNGQSTNPWYEVDTCYDANGNVSGKSYRYQSAGWGSAKLCTSGDTYAYDVLGRVTSVTRANGETIGYSYKGRATQITDENGVQRISQIDGLGRPKIVCEIASHDDAYGTRTNCGTDINVTATGWITSYSYALATGTTTVTQSAQTRTFQTDWLGRTVLVQEPESGQTTYSYAYNATGLVVTRTRPKANQTNTSVTTTSTMQYDTVGRLISATYNDGTTPTRTYTYDIASQWGATMQNPKGRMVQAWSAANAGAIFSYDAMGRVVWQPQCTPSKCGTGSYGPAYTYDWQGNLLTASNGDGYSNTYTYSRANEVQSITNTLNDGSHPPALVSSVQNGPFGPVNWHLGNGLYGVRSYDGLGRVNGGWLCSGSTQTYCTGGSQVYGFTTAWTGVRDTGECDTVLNKCLTHGYDELNRLTSRTVTSGTAENYTYAYDRYGNRLQQTALNGGFSTTLSFNSATNRINTAGFVYDAAGNLTNDGSHTYTYDAEGNMTAIDGGTTASFVYDALNRRVRVNKGSTSTEFVFNLNAQRASMWNASTGALVQGHTYWGATPVEFYSNGYAQFQHQDWLGTERMRTKYAAGASPTYAVDATFTSLPFGEGLTISGADNDAGHFATLDRDYYSSSSTTGTDHAQFRQYGNSQGRWMSPDPYGASYDSQDPQSLNRYTYLSNNPLSGIDTIGLAPNMVCTGSAETGYVCTITSWGGGYYDVFNDWPTHNAPPDPTGIKDDRGRSSGAGNAPNTNNPLKKWPLNGNLTPVTHQQDQKCSAGPVIGPIMDSIPGVLDACQWHDNKYIEYNCNATSWLSPFPGACKAMNYILLIKIYNALPKPF